jgi:hypothetical protein
MEGNQNAGKQAVVLLLPAGERKQEQRLAEKGKESWRKIGNWQHV